MTIPPSSSGASAPKLEHHSTGPRMAEGNATSSRNGYRVGERQSLRALAKLLQSFAVDRSVIAHRRGEIGYRPLVSLGSSPGNRADSAAGCRGCDVLEFVLAAGCKQP